MSLQVNLSSREINDAYQNVVAGGGVDWAVFTYDKGTNDLKVQSTGDGGLEELQEEFSDGRSVSCPAARLIQSELIVSPRIQYAFARVIDPNVRSFRSASARVDLRYLFYSQSKLTKFVQINWCGDGVPVAKKGLFHSHSSAVARFFRGTHVVVNARNEVCVFLRIRYVIAPDLISCTRSVRCHAFTHNGTRRSGIGCKVLYAQ